MCPMKKTGVGRDSQAKRSNSLKHLTEDELLDVFETARRRSPRDHALLIVCFQHALRASELISLKLGDIDWRNMEITIQRLKGSLKTTQPLFQMRGRPCMDEVTALRTWLKERPADSGSDFVFVSQKGRFNRNTVNRIFAKLPSFNSKYALILKALCLVSIRFLLVNDRVTVGRLLFNQPFRTYRSSVVHRYS